MADKLAASRSDRAIPARLRQRGRTRSSGCPSCHWLVHAERLKELAATAEAAERSAELSTALTAWNEALSLLPPDSRQYAAIAEKIATLGRRGRGRSRHSRSDDRRLPLRKPIRQVRGPHAGPAARSRESSPRWRSSSGSSSSWPWSC